MKKLLLLLSPVIFLTGCETTQPMPRDSYVGRKVEKMDGGVGTGINHPDLNPGRYDIYGRTHDRAIDGYDGGNNRYYDRNHRRRY